jgi:hypothetical protein
MSNSITNRMMQAEESANDDIAAKSYQHTSAYKLISDEGQAAAEAQALSGQAIHDVLLRRAKAKELGLDSFAYSQSKLSQGAYRDSAFNEGDEEARKSALGVAGARKNRENERKERATQRSRRQEFNAGGQVEEKGASIPGARQEFNSRRNVFQKPSSRNYNPYA